MKGLSHSRLKSVPAKTKRNGGQGKGQKIYLGGLSRNPATLAARLPSPGSAPIPSKMVVVFRRVQPKWASQLCYSATGGVMCRRLLNNFVVFSWVEGLCKAQPPPPNLGCAERRCSYSLVGQTSLTATDSRALKAPVDTVGRRSVRAVYSVTSECQCTYVA